MTDPKTIAVYDARADDYAQLETSERPSKTLAAFMSELPTGGHVLDLGCGPGTSARHMVDAGFKVTALDASEKMIALASQIPGVTARVAAFDDVTGAAVYDGVWANFSLLHAPRADLPRHLRAIHTALKPGGLFHIAVKDGEGEARDRMGRHYAYYTEDSLTELLQDAGFTVGPYRRGRDKGLSGLDENWISTTAHA
ncbi:class I SAM-dependent DNA methyltransferase [Marivita hallyeonensis]|uniref:Methyltransferase domain-containing protein n=1 Tax=Marivita hallyeonensis TaxID=996342 RepID=A0A1M5XCG9_9RHOB|nr:class I SAM-dependent methyltransferase [Marivita hallyeonensis]SHH97224.1 Methyltransferase domain-containing protein [Marivita hallyeonensis]